MTANQNPVPPVQAAGSLLVGTSRMAWLSLAVVLAAGCAYDPPVVGDRGSARYQADLSACQEAAQKAAHHAVISRFPLFITYPVSFPLRERAETRRCMASKGYPPADAPG